VPSVQCSGTEWVVVSSWQLAVEILCSSDCRRSSWRWEAAAGRSRPVKT
jgi:hypothetical protein